MAARAYIGREAPCRPWGGGQAPVARWGGRQAPFFFLQELRCKFEEKKLHFGPVALWEGDRGIFLKYFKTDIYFWNFNFFLNIKKKKPLVADRGGWLPWAVARGMQPSLARWNGLSRSQELETAC